MVGGKDFKSKFCFMERSYGYLRARLPRWHRRFGRRVGAQRGSCGGRRRRHRGGGKQIFFRSAKSIYLHRRGSDAPIFSRRNPAPGRGAEDQKVRLTVAQSSWILG